MSAESGDRPDSTDEGLDDEEDEEDVVLHDDTLASSKSRKRIKKRYAVSETSQLKYVPAWCRPNRLTRNERIYLVVGTIAVVAIVVVFVTVAVTASSAVTKSHDNGEAQGMEENETTEKWSDVRLQSSVIPNSYDISISVDLDTFQVTGLVNIACSVKASVDYVALHVKDMKIPDGHHLTRDDKNIEHNKVIYKPNDFFIFNLTEPLSPGLITISMSFSYILRKGLAGFYRSTYVDAQGTTQYLATTQFEPTDARQAFPCFDEPALKANFTIQITHHSRYRAWSNMPVASRSEEDSDGFVNTRFMTSVRMSTYLVAFIVSDFTCIGDDIRSTSGNSVRVQVCSNPVNKNHTKYALKVAMNVIAFYEQEFGVPYPLPKQDLFAIPDFSAGAMENWGLITYRETALLYNEDTDPASSKQRVALVIAHELAHQWFGNLVTMAWWDGLWLNEGFASFVEYIGADNYEPSFHMMQQFVADDLIRALALDGLNESHPILQKVEDPNEINSLFDSISYSKGASIIRMLRDHIGNEPFRAGIQTYLTKYQFMNAETHQLWEALQTATPKQDGNITEIMDTWTKQMGYPVFTLNRTEGNLAQTRFFSVKPKDLNSIASSPYNYLWKVPFDYMHVPGAGKDAKVTDLHLVTAPSTSVQWPSGGFVKANVNQTGFYRVNYELSDWRKISSFLVANIGSPNIPLSTNDRAGLLDDAFALSRAGLLDIEVAFNLSTYLAGENEYIPWSVGLSWFYTLDGLLSLHPKYGNYQSFMGVILDDLNMFSTEDTNGLSHLQIYLRSALLGAAAHFGNKEVIQNATEIFRQWKEGNRRVDPNLKSLVYGAGIEYGDKEDWEFVWKKYNQSHDPSEKKLYLSALARSREHWILYRYMNYSVTRLRRQDTLSVIIYVSRNIHGRYLAWNFVRSNWDFLFKRYGKGSFFSRFILYITASFSTEAELQQLKDLYERYPNAGTATRGFRQAIEAVRGNIAWMKSF